MLVPLLLWMEYTYVIIFPGAKLADRFRVTLNPKP